MNKLLAMAMLVNFCTSLAAQTGVTVVSAGTENRAIQMYKGETLNGCLFKRIKEALQQPYWPIVRTLHQCLSPCFF